MFVVVAQDVDGAMSIYGAFSTERAAEEWTDGHRDLRRVGIELTVLPVLDPRADRRRGQRSAVEYMDTIAKVWGR